VRLNLFKQIPAKLKTIDRRIDGDGKLFFTFNKGFPDPAVKIYDTEMDAQKTVAFSHNADTAQIYLPIMAFDSVKLSFLSGGKPLDTIILHKRKNEIYKRTIQLQYNTNEDRLKLGNDLTVTTNYPIASIDQSRIILIEDTVDAGEVKVIRDQKDTKIFTVKYPWKEGKRYSISFNLGTITDIYGDKSTLTKKIIVLDKPENYSTLTLKVILPDTGKQYIVQLLNPNSGDVVHSDVIKKSGSVVYKDYPTGKYGVRVVYDANKNGQWDTGDLKAKTYPENIWYLKKAFDLRSNFEIDDTLIIPKEIPNP
jgi:hypothetical protein